MPSFISKILQGGKNNPYTNPHHPNHPRTSQSAPTSTTASQTFSSNSPRGQVQPRPASPREQRDYLAEAREASGRDPITGRLRPRTQGGVSQSSGEREGRTEGRSVYRQMNEERMSRGQATSGTKYDLFVQEMKARKGGRWRAPDGGFYAPERRIGEFYQPEQGR